MTKNFKKILRWGCKINLVVYRLQSMKNINQFWTTIEENTHARIFCSLLDAEISMDAALEAADRAMLTFRQLELSE